jgi:hypothetical protein
MIQKSSDQRERPDFVPGEREFVAQIREGRTSGQPAVSKLQTDDRVLARITDGIYRQPSSALRELISNAYDADATEVIIETDAPRFREIRIRDNGQGMDDEALARLIHHIGGSSKRTPIGAAIGTTDDHNPNLSKLGRKLIGKIGIGLFSVNQLTSHFQIITKVKGTDHRLFADVLLKTYSEEELPTDGKFDSGSVKVLSVPAEDTEAHGTEIILKEVRPRARNILRSFDVWQRQFEKNDNPEDERDEPEPPPPWHSGYIAADPADEDASFTVAPSLPWQVADDPLTRFQSLFRAVSAQTDVTERPEIGKTLDAYLATLWTLSLSSPVPYLEKHPFDLGEDDDVMVFQLSNMGRGRAVRVDLAPGQTVRQKLGLKAGADDPAGGFRVFVDQVELRRPISFKFWPGRTSAFTKTMLFVGSYRPNLTRLHPDLRGGDLAFESYLFWNNRIVPKENTGVLVRINGASNAIFDDTFMRYQVSEQTRLRQITSEILVSQGVDAALNIDRESFNFAHPHYQIVSNWVHRALRQLANTHKGLGDEIRAATQERDNVERATKLTRFAAATWEKARRKSDDTPPDVEIFRSPVEAAAARRQGVIALDQNQLPLTSGRRSKQARQEQAKREQIAKAIATVLDGFGLLTNMPYARQHELIAALIAVFYEDAQDA